MFPTFDVPPQHSETVGARKARRAKEEEIARRSSSATSRSSGSTRSAANSSEPRTHERSGFGWFGTSKKGIQEISALPATKKQNVLPNSMLEPESKTKAVQSQQDVDRRQSNQTGKDDQSLGPQNLSSPLLESFPSPPPVGALPLPPSTGLLSLPGTCDLQSIRPSQMAQLRSGERSTRISVLQVIFSPRHVPCLHISQKEGLSIPRHRQIARPPPIEAPSLRLRATMVPRLSSLVACTWSL